VTERNEDSDVELPFKFTGKELDPETNLYYYGARYMDPRLGRFVSVDGYLNRYLPTGDKERDEKLPGMGGVFNPVNLSVYHYAANNPVKFVDPDGNAPKGHQQVMKAVESTSKAAQEKGDTFNAAAAITDNNTLSIDQRGTPVYRGAIMRRVAELATDVIETLASNGLTCDEGKFMQMLGLEDFAVGTFLVPNPNDKTENIPITRQTMQEFLDSSNPYAAEAYYYASEIFSAYQKGPEAVDALYKENVGYEYLLGLVPMFRMPAYDTMRKSDYKRLRDSSQKRE